jgi:hypothetical protein
VDAAAAGDGDSRSASVDRDGTVAEVKVLRSASTLLDREAYSPSNSGGNSHWC